MLELSTYGNIPVQDKKEITTTVFVIIDDLYQAVVPKEVKERLSKEKAKLSDSEIITISIIGEMMSNDSEKAWLSYVSKNMRDLFPCMCERSRFNRTRRNLVRVIDYIRICLNSSFDACTEDLRIADSFPLQVCEFGRANFCRSFSGRGASYGVCPSKKLTYYGYKVHALCTTNGFITDFVLTSANVDDREAVWELIDTHNHHICMIGDKGYISTRLAIDLQNEK